MSRRVKIQVAILAPTVAFAAGIAVGADRALAVSYDQSLYILTLVLVFVAGDALRRALRR